MNCLSCNRERTMKLDTLKYFFISLMAMLCSSCDHAELKFTLINKAGRTITLYRPPTLPVENLLIYRFFTSKNSTNTHVSEKTHISLDFKVDPFSQKDHFSMYSFSSQFKTVDGKLHLIILDVDSLKSMAQKHKLDSNSINRAILKHIVYSKAELEKNNKTIVYEE